MKKLCFAATMAMMTTGAAFADPVEGLWKTEPGDTGGYLYVTMAKCGDAICGTIKQAFKASGVNSDGYEHLGKRMIWDMKTKSGGAYSGGKIWAPDRDKTYKSKLQLNGDTMEVSGCVLVVCRDQNWTRVK